MIHIKKFIDRMSVMESRKNKDLVMTMEDARGLRDEVSKLLVDLHELSSNSKNNSEVIEVEIKGGTF